MFMLLVDVPPARLRASSEPRLQGQSATDAWKEVDRLARKFGIPVGVRFQWRESPKAQHPGKIGLIRSGRG
ncbi:MAG: hypothetical protein E5Y77_22410 [Mesorhizobium sp.]|nr:MAG: hypothetical protein E5Y77_22410 [Mesorhizobium sp.]